MKVDFTGHEDLENAIKDLKDLDKSMPKVAVRALNKAMDGVRTEAPRILNEKYNFKIGVVKKRIKVTRANYATLSGAVTSKGGPFHLSDFTGTSDTIGSGDKKRKNPLGVMVNVRKDTGRQLIPRAFKATGRHSGKVIVLRRPGKPRGQHADLWGRYGPPGSGGKAGSQARLDTFYGPYPEDLYNTPENWAKLKDVSAARLDESMAEAVDAELRKQAGQW